MDDSCNKLLIFGRSMWIYWNLLSVVPVFFGIPSGNQTWMNVHPIYSWGCHSPHKCWGEFQVPCFDGWRDPEGIPCYFLRVSGLAQEWFYSVV
jgi:hypothetical protein